MAETIHNGSRTEGLVDARPLRERLHRSLLYAQGITHNEPWTTAAHERHVLATSNGACTRHGHLAQAHFARMGRSTAKKQRGPVGLPQFDRLGAQCSDCSQGPKCDGGTDLFAEHADRRGAGLRGAQRAPWLPAGGEVPTATPLSK